MIPAPPWRARSPPKSGEPGEVARPAGSGGRYVGGRYRAGVLRPWDRCLVQERRWIYPTSRTTQLRPESECSDVPARTSRIRGLALIGRRVVQPTRTIWATTKSERPPEHSPRVHLGRPSVGGVRLGKRSGLLR